MTTTTYIALSFTHRFASLVRTLALLLLVLLATVACRSTAPTSQGCADQLGIEWSVEDGATEQLDAFAACLAG